MSKKHFVALADAIRMNRAAFTDKQLWPTAENLQHMILTPDS
jgi:hypothetical protein